MKKLIAGLLAMLLLLSISQAEDLDFRSMTGLDELQKKLDNGVTIDKVYYTDGYGFSTSEFSSDDPDEIRRLWETLNKIQVVGLVNESITDWYPQIVFYLSDGSHANVSFESHWLCIGRYNYEITKADEFWMLTAELLQKHEQMDQGAVPGGWNPWEDLTAEELETATGLTFGVPDGAEEAIYRFLRSEGLAEMQFMIGEDIFNSRMMPAVLEEGQLKDISGLEYDWVNKESVRIGEYDGIIQQARDGEAWIEVCLWYNGQIMHSLSVYSTDLDGLDLTAIAEQI